MMFVYALDAVAPSVSENIVTSVNDGPKELIVLLVILLLVASGIAYFFIFRKRKPSAPPTEKTAVPKEESDA